MTKLPQPVPPAPLGAARALFLVLPGLTFLLGCLVMWLYLRGEQAAPPAPSTERIVERQPPSSPPPDVNIGLFRQDNEGISRGAVTLIGVGGHGGPGVLMEFPLLLAGQRHDLWKLEEIHTAIPLRSGPLAGVADGTPVAMLPTFRVRHKQGNVPDLAHYNDDEAEAFCEALYKANLTSTDAFANTARHDLTFAELFNNPKKHRGEVVHFEGDLHRVRTAPAPIMAKAKGVDHLYEGWAFNTSLYGPNPVCLVFTELPPEVPVAEKMDVPISFDGYFFKKYRYQSADSKPGYARETVLFLGRAPVPLKGPSAARTAEGHSNVMLTVVLGGILVLALLAFGLNRWMRSSDEAVRARLERARRKSFLEPSGPSFPDTTPSPN